MELALGREGWGGEDSVMIMVLDILVRFFEGCLAGKKEAILCALTIHLQNKGSDLLAPTK